MQDSAMNTFRNGLNCGIQYEFLKYSIHLGDENKTQITTRESENEHSLLSKHVAFNQWEKSTHICIRDIRIINIQGNHQV